MVTVTVRLPHQMIKRLDVHATERQRVAMGAPYTRSDAIRDLVREGLEHHKKAGAT